jgi:uncharacterized repeat protein (TIGR01451 family)
MNSLTVNHPSSALTMAGDRADSYPVALDQMTQRGKAMKAATGRAFRVSVSFFLVLSAGAVTAIGLATPASATISSTFTSTNGEQTYTVPPGVDSITITAVGAPGGAGAIYPGSSPGASTPGQAGDGASVTATVTVISGQTLYVEVGGSGSTGPCNGGVTGSAFNGGGSGYCGGGGGGASDVRTCSASTCTLNSDDTRLVVAGGGGGGGGALQETSGNGGQAGDTTVTGAGAGGNGCDYCNGGVGDNGGFGSPAGTGGPGTKLWPAGNDGQLGQGGDANSADSGDLGGAGGGGYDGGGAGGDGESGGGGGGGGSSYWITGATDTSMAEDTTATPEVTITPGLAGYANLSLVKSATTQTPTVGTPDLFNLTASNSASSTSDTGQVVVTDVLAPSLTLNETSIPGNTTASASGQTVTWTIPDIPIGASDSLELKVTPNTGTAFTNTATFTQNAPNSSGATSGSSNGLTITPAYAAVTVTKAATTTNPSFGGQDTFTLTAANAATSTAASGPVVVTDPLPAGLSYVSATSAVGTVAETSVMGVQTVTWTIPTIAINTSDTLMIVVGVNTASATNTATYTQTVPNFSGATSGNSNPVTVSVCGHGYTAHVLTATSRTGNFVGVFCVTASGSGTYSQSGGAHGSGTVLISGTTTRISASGTGLALLGEKTATSSTFTETAPAPMKAGTFTLS